MDEEMEAMREHNVWTLVALPEGRKPVGVKWVFKVKRKEDGSLERFKARLTAKGYAQRHGEDYDQTYSPVGKFTTSRTLLAMATLKAWHLHQMDVSNAFLNGHLDEEVYMEQPTGYEDGSGRVCRLNKAIYGLKQAPRCWNEEIGRCLSKGRFHQSGCDPSLWLRGEGENLVVVLVYVDDLLIASPSFSLIASTKSLLQATYKMKDLGEVSLFLGMHIKRSVKGGWLELGQERYIRTWEEKYKEVFEGLKMHWSCPMGVEDGKAFKKGLGPRRRKGEQRMYPEEVLMAGAMVDSTLYQSIVGSIMFAATTTRPDLAFSASVLAQFNSEPREQHLNAAVRVLRYALDTSHMVLRYEARRGYERGGDVEIVGYTDATWGGEEDARSRGSYAFLVGGAAVSWRSKKQETVAKSSCEAEYMALSEGVSEAVWLRRLVEELGGGNQPVKLLVDSQSAISIAHNPTYHNRTKHMNIHFHFVREKVKSRDVVVEFVPSKEQAADFFTKALCGDTHWTNMEMLGMKEKEDSC
jgi:histone deacetylase 1/2